MCLWCISAIGGGWWIMYPSPSSLAHSLTERGGQKVRNFRAFQSPSNIINPPGMQKWNLATSDLESYIILDVLVKYHKSRVLLIKWSQFFGVCCKPVQKQICPFRVSWQERCQYTDGGVVWRRDTWGGDRKGVDFDLSQVWSTARLPGEKISSPAPVIIILFTCKGVMSSRRQYHHCRRQMAWRFFVIFIQRVGVSETKKEDNINALGWIFNFVFRSINAFVFVFRYLKSNHNFWNCAFISCQRQVCSS